MGAAPSPVVRHRHDHGVRAGLLEDPTLDPRGAIRNEVAPGVDVLPAHTSLEAVGVALAAIQGQTTRSISAADKRFGSFTSYPSFFSSATRYSSRASAFLPSFSKNSAYPTRIPTSHHRPMGAP